MKRQEISMDDFLDYARNFVGNYEELCELASKLWAICREVEAK